MNSHEEEEESVFMSTWLYLFLMALSLPLTKDTVTTHSVRCSSSVRVAVTTT